MRRLRKHVASEEEDSAEPAMPAASSTDKVRQSGFAKRLGFDQAYERLKQARSIHGRDVHHVLAVADVAPAENPPMAIDDDPVEDPVLQRPRNGRTEPQGNLPSNPPLEMPAATTATEESADSKLDTKDDAEDDVSMAGSNGPPADPMSDSADEGSPEEE